MKGKCTAAILLHSDKCGENITHDVYGFSFFSVGVFVTFEKVDLILIKCFKSCLLCK